ncbi:MAG: class I SAM-dependent methyltransferase [Kofleriaceae bacterium]
MKTDYAAHDARYRALRERGAVGWSTDDDYLERREQLAPYLARTRGRLLELGCGAGNMLAWLIERGFDVSGIDISDAAIEWARERAPNAHFEVGNAVITIAGEFDVILDGNCLHCIVGDDRARLLANIHAALRPGGVFIASTMCGPIHNPKLLAQFDPATRCQIVDGVSYRYIGDADAILAELRAANFTIADFHIEPRKHPDDQDHLITFATRP